MSHLKEQRTEQASKEATGEMVQKPYQFGRWQGCDDFQSKEKDSIVSIEVRVVEASMEAGSRLILFFAFIK